MELQIKASDIIFRSSSIGKLCGPKGLGITGKKEARKTYLEYTTGRTKEFSSKQTEKGIKLEPVSIKQYSELVGRELKKNDERKTNAYFTGECDIDDVEDDCIVDCKNSYDLFTFDDACVDFDDKYEWQMQIYMHLWGCKNAKLFYTLNDSPDGDVLKKIEQENYYHPNLETPEWRQVQIITNMVYTRKSFERLVNSLGLGGDELTDKLINLFVEIPFEKRHKIWDFKYDEEKIKFAMKRVDEAREYLTQSYNIK